MSTFRLDDHREVRLVDVADISYMPDIYLRRAAAAGEAKAEPMPLLTVVLASGERVRLEGKAATAAWEDFQRAAGVTG